MSQTFSSLNGNYWRAWQLGRVLIASGADRELLRVVAEGFDSEGTWSPGVAVLCEQCGINPETGQPVRSRGSVLRSLGQLEKLGVIRLTRRGGGPQWRTIVIHAVGWLEFLRQRTTRQESPACDQGDSWRRERGLHSAEDPTHQESDSRQDSRPGTESAPPTPSPATTSPAAPAARADRDHEGPAGKPSEARCAPTARQPALDLPSPGVPGKDQAARHRQQPPSKPRVKPELVPAQLFAVWNRVAQARGMVVAREMTHSREKVLWRAGEILTKAGASITAWETFLHWLADDPFNLGEGNARWAGLELNWLALEQHLLPRLERWNHEITGGQPAGVPSEPRSAPPALVSRQRETPDDRDESWPHRPELDPPDEVIEMAEAWFNPDGSWKDDRQSRA